MRTADYPQFDAELLGALDAMTRGVCIAAHHVEALKRRRWVRIDAIVLVDGIPLAGCVTTRQGERELELWRRRDDRCGG